MTTTSNQDSPAATILVIDDEASICFAFERFFGARGYRVLSAGTGAQGLALCRSELPDILFVDVRLPDADGLDLLEELHSMVPDSCIIVITAYGSLNAVTRAIREKAFDCLVKPLDLDRALDLAEQFVEARSRLASASMVEPDARQTDLTTDAFPVIGESAAMQGVFKAVARAAATDASVLITGETGTGKDLIAQLIHQKSERKLYPFVAVDCGAIPETLFESEMFGHEKGSFTGAIQQRKGKFELANKGTLFLDELCNLPLKQQTKLLRVIQNRTITRLGGKEMIDVDVRLISSCNKPITELVEHGDFKDDLYFRINEFHISIPPLRERKRDIILLANFFRIESNNELQKDVKGFSVSAVNQMMEYGWQGNVRELKNVIKKAVLLCDAKHIKPEHLMFMGSDKAMNRKKTFADKRDKPEDKKYPPKSEHTNTISEAVKDTKRQQIKQALDQTSGNKSQAAKILGISRRQLYREMERYGMD